MHNIDEKHYKRRSPLIIATDDATHYGFLCLDYRLVIIVHVDLLLCLFLLGEEGGVVESQDKKQIRNTELYILLTSYSHGSKHNFTEPT